MFFLAGHPGTLSSPSGGVRARAAGAAGGGRHTIPPDLCRRTGHRAAAWAACGRAAAVGPALAIDRNGHLVCVTGLPYRPAVHRAPFSSWRCSWSAWRCRRRRASAGSTISTGWRRRRFYAAPNDRAVGAAIVLHAVSFVPVAVVGLVLLAREGISLAGVGSRDADRRRRGARREVPVLRAISATRSSIRARARKAKSSAAGASAWSAAAASPATSGSTRSRTW